MQLSDFIKSNSIPPRKFAATAGLSLDAVYKYMRGERMPNEEQMRMIFDATAGQVTANDFYGLTEKPKKKKKSDSHA